LTPAIDSRLNTATSYSSAAQPSETLITAILRALIYYDLFNYPLTAEEIARNCSEKDCDVEAVEVTLRDLYLQGKVFRYERFYSVRDSEEIFLKRLNGNQSAKEVMKKVYRRAKLISNFPFVRGVCISGSLSKNYFDASCDADFFIITEPNRLWICRTLLVFFKKIFLLNSKKYFCVNYFIDTESLEIPDKNIFTATEIVTLLPAYNYELYRNFYRENNWVKSFFPNCHPRVHNGTLETSDPALRRILEKLLGGNLGEWLDKFFFKSTLRRWRKKFGSQPHHEFELNMRSRRSVSKHHPQGFQFHVLKAYDERISKFEEEFELQLNDSSAIEI